MKLWRHAGRASLSSARRSEARASSATLLRFQRGAVRTPRPTIAGSARGTLAFTIIEVIIALSIFMMIILSIYSIWTGIVKASIAARIAADQAQRARVSMNAIHNALNCAQMFSVNTTYYTFIADMNRGDYGTLSFVAHLPANFPGVGRYGDNVVRRVTFTCKKEDGPNLSLIMSQGPMLQAENEEFKPYELTLAKDVTMFAFECWGVPDPTKPNDHDWVDVWKSTNSLPKLMRIGLGLGGKSGEPQSMTVKIIALPASVVTPDLQPGPGGRPGGPGQPNSGNPINRIGPGGVPQ